MKENEKDIIYYQHLLFYHIGEIKSMIRNTTILILLAVYFAFFYLFKTTQSIWGKVISVLLAIMLTCLCLFVYLNDRNQAYYGDSIFNHQVLPFNLQIVNGNNHDLGCKVYSIGRFGEVFTGEQEIVIQTDSHTPNQYICMQTILSYGYNKGEIIINWLGCDSCEYWIRIDSESPAAWRYISPSQLITKEQINEEDYKWVYLVKVLWLRKGEE